ncbi:MAG TPA: hypothetical protein VG917_02085 [Patescibacteria group bacterium]|nr:hypothetical protein [Patescibacteria group bacterium]
MIAVAVIDLALVLTYRKEKRIPYKIRRGALLGSPLLAIVGVTFILHLPVIWAIVGLIICAGATGHLLGCAYAVTSPHRLDLGTDTYAVGQSANKGWLTLIIGITMVVGSLVLQKKIG